MEKQIDQIFVCHIPKTAGTSLWVSAHAHFKASERIYGIHYSELAAIPVAKLRTYKYIHGHFPLSASQALGASCFRLFFVREPRSRVLSLYNFWRRAFLAAPEQWTEGSGPYYAGNHSLLEFLRDGGIQLEINNAQARYACGSSITLSVDGIGLDTLREAVTGVNACGICEHFDSSVMRINDLLGFELFNPSSMTNVSREIAVSTEAPRSVANLRSAELRALDEILDLDKILYDLAIEHFWHWRGPQAAMAAPPARPKEVRIRPEDVGQWFHSIELPGGIVTPGSASLQALRAKSALFFGMGVSGRSVLDIGALDGFYSFEAERRGASRITAVDKFCWGGGGLGSKLCFDYARSELGSRVEDRVLALDQTTLENVGGQQYDIVLFNGILYHTMDALHALKHVAQIARYVVTIDTHGDCFDIPRPVLVYYPGEKVAPGFPQNGVGVNSLFMFALLKRLGFATLLEFSTPAAGYAGRRTYFGFKPGHPFEVFVARNAHAAKPTVTASGEPIPAVKAILD